jgi:SAM-dependent methyltransferase
MKQSCSVCGGTDFSQVEVLWPELISEWELHEDEVQYINRQQGFHCVGCGNNLRSMAIASAIVNSFQFSGTLREFVRSDFAQSLKVLEINEAGSLTSTLNILPNHILARYPEYDMTNLSFESLSFDLVLHSDTLEHVADPVAGLTECRRVLNKNDRCIFTVPIIVNRLSRSRKGLTKSYHGSSTQNESDYLVQTEFGADAWKFAVEAGFSRVCTHVLEYPSALAIEATLK